MNQFRVSNMILYRRIRWGFLTLLALGLVFALGCGGDSATAGKSPPSQAASGSLPAVGHSVGDRILPFTARLVDGSTVRSDELLRQSKPTFIFFFKPGCSVCFAEARRLKNIYPDYAGRVTFLALSYSPTFDLDHGEEVWEQENWPWLIGEPMGTMARDYRVVVSSTKIAFDSRGVIIYRAGFGEGGDDEFRQVFNKLVASG